MYSIFCSGVSVSVSLDMAYTVSRVSSIYRSALKLMALAAEQCFLPVRSQHANPHSYACSIPGMFFAGVEVSVIANLCWQVHCDFFLHFKITSSE